MPHFSPKRSLITQKLISPRELAVELPASQAVINQITNHRETIRKILHREDERLLIVLGPCSIHDPEAALAYAEVVRKWQKHFEQDVFLVMRCYFEKPRTEPNWKGFLHDPDLDDSGNLPKGLRKARELLLAINHLGVACATEFIDPLAAPYWSDLISWAAIGARTTQSQIHRELASGLPMPIGFKNTPSGNIQAAIDAIRVASSAQTTLGIDSHGQAAFIRTRGNPDLHLVLRGADKQPNYQLSNSLDNNQLVEKLKAHHLNPRVMIDCSHGNSQKDHNRQYQLALELSDQRSEQVNQTVMGLMLESFLKPGKQDYDTKGQLKPEYGVSITDACLGLDQTEAILCANAKMKAEINVAKINAIV